MNYNPKRTKFCKQHRGQMRGVATRCNSICFGRFGLQAFGPAWITSRQIEARRRAIICYAHHNGKIWIHIFLNKLITMQLTETRIGSRKKSREYWVSIVKPNRIFYEINGVPTIVARIDMKIVAYKMPICTQFVIFISDKK